MATRVQISSFGRAFPAPRVTTDARWNAKAAKKLTIDVSVESRGERSSRLERWFDAGVTRGVIQPAAVSQSAGGSVLIRPLPDGNGAQRARARAGWTRPSC